MLLWVGRERDRAVGNLQRLKQPFTAGALGVMQKVNLSGIISASLKDRISFIMNSSAS